MSTFQNPAQFADPTLTNPDPFVLSYLGAYYCYSTDEDGVRVSSSPDLVHWEYHGFAFTDSDRRAFWAPCVVYRNGTFYMYVSDRPAGVEDNHEQRLRVATASHPLGPFTSQRRLRDDRFAIDADVVVAEDGSPLMFYASNEFTGLSLDRPGTAIVVDRMTDLTHLAGDPHPVVVPTLEQEVFAEDRFGDGRDWHTIEGAAFFTHRDHAYLTYSGNAYLRPDYFIGYARAPLGPSFDQLAWQKMPGERTFAPLMYRTDEVEGTGHNSVIQAPNLVDWWIVYHGRNLAEERLEGVEQRQMRLDRLHFDGDKLWTEGPSANPVAAPSPAGIQWSQPVQLPPARLAEEIFAEAVGPYVSEFWVRAEPGDSGARFALVPIRHGDLDQLAFWFDAGAQTVTARQLTNGIWTDLDCAHLTDFDFAAWQPLQVERGLAEVVLRRGHQVLLRVPHAAGLDPAGVAVLGQFTRVEVGSARLTEHFDWHPSQGGALAAAVRADQPLAVTSTGYSTGQTAGLWAERADLTLIASPAHHQWAVTMDLWLPAPDSTVRVEGTATGSPLLVTAKSGAKQTVRLTAAAGDQVRLHLERASLTGLTRTQITQSESTTTASPRKGEPNEE
ncbi:glycoside hydrolase family 43 protein [Actinomyces sp. F1_1611]